MKLTLEICIDSIDSAIAAIDGGADRLEVCSALAVGGLTPSLGLIKSISDYIKQSGRFVQIASMIRPRPGDFNYNQQEINQMRQEISCLKDYSDCLVFGCLCYQDNQVIIDQASCSVLLKDCQPKQVTFHRAFDLCSDKISSCQTLIDCGFNRILTSGGESTAILGLETIKQCQLLSAESGLSIMPGSGINVDNIEQIQKITQVTELHSSASSQITSVMAATCNRIFSSGVATWQVTDRSKVAQMKTILNNIQSNLN